MPLIKDPKDCDELLIQQAAQKLWAIVCNKDKASLRGTKMLDYIEWGETYVVRITQGADKGKTVKGLHRLPFFRNRQRWWDIGLSHFPSVVLPKAVGDTHKLCFLPFEAMVDQRFYAVYSQFGHSLCCALSSTLWMLFKEILGRRSLGGGALDLSTADLRQSLVLAPRLIESQMAPDVLLQPFAGRKWLPYEEEFRQTDRRELDRVVFAALGLTEDEQVEVYRAVVQLVKDRLSKARSVRTAKTPSTRLKEAYEDDG